MKNKYALVHRPYINRLGARSNRVYSGGHQQGIALVFVLLMIVVALGVALITARLTLTGDRASRNDRDYQIAFQAAELALNDAELDIMDPDINHAKDKDKSNATQVQKARACLFGHETAGIVVEEGCGKDTANRGVCGLDPAKPDEALYKYVEWNETDNAKRTYVNFGEYTGRSGELATGTNTTSAKPPKYVIFQPNKNVVTKVMIKKPDGTPYDPVVKSTYRVYALGYGSNPNTTVMLSADVHKPVFDKAACP